MFFDVWKAYKEVCGGATLAKEDRLPLLHALAQRIREDERKTPELEAMMVDARRYRWLRDNAKVGNPFPNAPRGSPPFQISFRLNVWGKSLDEVIDAASRECERHEGG